MDAAGTAATGATDTDGPERAWMFPQVPPADLATDIVCSWRAAAGGRHRLVPDGCVDVLWHDQGSMWVCGPETAAWEFRLPPGTTAVGVRFRPGAARRVLRTDLQHLANQRARLADVLGGGVERELSERIGSAPGPDQLRVMEGVVRRWSARARAGDAHDRALAVLATADEPPSVDALADEVGLSARQVHRRSVRLFGYGPTTLIRLIRFQRFILRAQRGGPASLGLLAAASGYADQAHLVRECRAIVGEPPSVFLPSHDETFPAASDPYKTPWHARSYLDRHD